MLSPRSIILPLCIAVLAASVSLAQPMQPRVVSPSEYILGDTSRPIRTNVPGEVTQRYTRVQDSLYALALAAPVSSSARFIHDTRTMSATLQAMEQSQRSESTMDAILRTMAIPSSLYLPLARDVVQHQIHIANAMYVPGILLRPMGTGNLQVNFNQIAKFFGLTEDVSPVIRYSVEETQQVTIVVYSTQAKVIATLFDAIQGAGVYELVWNGRDEHNVVVPNGDYIAEVRLGNERIMRKRIQLPTPQ